MSEKHCPVCDETKPVGEFYRDPTKTDGLAYRCKQCEHAYRTSMRDERNAADRAWRAKNREHSRAYMREYMRRYRAKKKAAAK